MSAHDAVWPYLPRVRPLPTTSTDRTCSTLLGLAALGGIIGASATAGANIRRVQQEEISAGQALGDTGRAALTAATAAAIAGAAATLVANEGLTRLGVLFVTGTAVVYGMQRWREGG